MVPFISFVPDESYRLIFTNSSAEREAASFIEPFSTHIDSSMYRKEKNVKNNVVANLFIYFCPFVFIDNC